MSQITYNIWDKMVDWLRSSEEECVKRLEVRPLQII
nr:MAG TPA: hypothetical protein [Caudoviricetes sp.]